jgi:hypothetical protein
VHASGGIKSPVFALQASSKKRTFSWEQFTPLGAPQVQAEQDRVSSTAPA